MGMDTLGMNVLDTAEDTTTKSPFTHKKSSVKLFLSGDIETLLFPV